MSNNVFPQNITFQASAFLSLLMLCAACGQVELNVPNKFLNSSTLIESLNQSSVETIATTVVGYKEASDGLIIDGIDLYKIVYKTQDAFGMPTTASGLVAIPQTTDNIPILSFQRETHCYEYDFNNHDYPICWSDKNTPSTNPDIPEFRAMKVISGSGYVTVIPDLLGFGENIVSEHPYEHGSSLASVSFDMIMATKEFLIEKKITTNDKHFLSGYGTGGYATMALHKYIEDSSDLKVTMSAPAAGLYDKLLLSNTAITDLKFYGFAELMTSFVTYDKVYGLNRHNSQRNPYSARDFPDDFSEMVSNFKNGMDQELISAVKDNNRSDWYPNAPITMYQGIGSHQFFDEQILHDNGRATYENLKSNGAKIQLIEYSDKNLQTALPIYLTDMYRLFYNLK